MRPRKPWFCSGEEMEYTSQGWTYKKVSNIMPRCETLDTMLLFDRMDQERLRRDCLIFTCNRFRMQHIKRVINRGREMATGSVY